MIVAHMTTRETPDTPGAMALKDQEIYFVIGDQNTRHLGRTPTAMTDLVSALNQWAAIVWI